ncbi:MAG: cellulose synthase/poly-beta-1,6-N-acetylglucosamine synthase-like glycosyltransferase [Bradyrhizobium sp.]
MLQLHPRHCERSEAIHRAACADKWIASAFAKASADKSSLQHKHIQQEITLNWNNFIRQSHRWLSIVFTVAVIINIIAMVLQQQAVWIGLLALFPLIPMLLSGLYLFALPYLAPRRRLGGSTSASQV